MHKQQVKDVMADELRTRVAGSQRPSEMMRKAFAQLTAKRPGKAGAFAMKQYETAITGLKLLEELGETVELPVDQLALYNQAGLCIRRIAEYKTELMTLLGMLAETLPDDALPNAWHAVGVLNKGLVTPCERIVKHCGDDDADTRAWLAIARQRHERTLAQWKTLMAKHNNDWAEATAALAVDVMLKAMEEFDQTRSETAEVPVCGKPEGAEGAQSSGLADEWK